MCTDGGANFAQGFWNTATGAPGTGNAGGDVTLARRQQVNLGNGWWRVELTATMGATPRTMKILISAVNADNTSNTTAGQALTVWGAQAENYGGATTFCVAGVTRNPDVLYYPQSGNMNPLVGSFYMESTLVSGYAPPAGGYVTQVSVDNTSEIFSLYSNGTQGFIRTDGTNLTVGGGAGLVPPANPRKCASSWSNTANGGKRSIVMGGTTLVTGACTAGLPSLSFITLGGSSSASAASMGTFRNLRIYPRQLTDAQLTALVA
jgi:hypothetical protein